MSGRPRTYILNPRNDMLTDIASGEQIRLSDVKQGRPVVAVDPGHGVMKPMKRGGHIYDVGTGGTESVITKAMSRALASELNSQGIDVIITHDSSRQIAGDGFDFRNRAARAADAFIAVHADSADNKKAHGSRVFSFSANAPGDDLRAIIAAHLPGDHIFDKVARRKHHDVTAPRNVGDTPAILLELGFISNARESRNLNSASWRKQVAKELASDIHAFLSSPVTKESRTPNAERDRRQAQEERDDPRPARKADAHPGMHILHHDIQRGDTYRHLSEVYHVSVADLQHVNHGRVPKVGREVIIPHVRNYTVDDHDSLYSIATRIAATDGPKGVRPNEVIALMRQLNPELRSATHIKPDDDLVVPTNAAAVRHMQHQIKASHK